MSKEALSLLASYFQKQLEILENIFQEIKPLRPLDENETVRAGYLLHNLYCAIEDLFLEVARTFENRVEDPARFHRDLLKRISLDIAGIRPRLISERSYSLLDELRRFRHVFRHAYDYHLEPERVEHLQKKILAQWKLVQADLEAFKAFLISQIKKNG